MYFNFDLKLFFKILIFAGILGWIIAITFFLIGIFS